MGLFGKKKKEPPAPAPAPVPQAAPQPQGDGAVTYNGDPNAQHIAAIDEGLAAAYNEYFAHLPFIPGTPQGNAYLELLARAEGEALRRRAVFTAATNYDDAVIDELAAKTSPENNALYYGAIYKVGDFGIIEEDGVYSLDFIDEIPHCVALALLLRAQKLPADGRKLQLEVEPDAPLMCLEPALELMKQCDPSIVTYITKAAE